MSDETDLKSKRGNILNTVACYHVVRKDCFVVSVFLAFHMRCCVPI